MQIQSNVAACTAAISDSLQKALLRAANVARNQIVQNLSGGRSGIQYKVPGTQTYYTASAPGEYPAVATGRLRSDVQYKQDGDGVVIGSTLEYGLHLEKKDPQHGGREWLRPSLEKARPDMLKAIGERWF